MNKNPHGNWIADTNRWNLPQPPDFFLTGLHSYDDQLVIIPSRNRRQYLLTRRARLTAGLTDVAMHENKHPDTNMCYHYGVIPIAPLASRAGKEIEFTQQNLQSLLDTLKERDAWAKGEELGVGGGPNIRRVEAVADDVDLFDEKQEALKDKAIREGFYHQGRDAWRSLQARMGWRNKRASDYHGVARTQPSGGVILTDAQ